MFLLVELLVPLAGIIAVFGPIFYVIKRSWDLKEKRLAAAEDPKLLEGMKEERRLLQERVENLEAIVCNVDYELNLKIAKLRTGPLLKAGELDDANDDGGDATADGAGNPATDRTITAAELGGKAALARSVNAPAELAIDSVLANRYKVQRLLGRGGMGAVYLAHDEVLEELVALKVISSAWAADERAMIERFRREASAARKVSSPNVIRIHDLGEAPGGLLYLSMEYFAGRTLADVMATKGSLDSTDGYDILCQVCDGLGAAHDAGVVHRDLKPHNVLVGERNAVKIIDFGLAKAAQAEGMTATGLLLGTPHYMSPEQVRGRPVDARSDIYALGALTYHAVCGRPPFDGDTPIAIGFAHVSDTPAPPRSLRPRLRAEVAEMILKALAKDPRERPQSAAEFRTALS